MKKLLLASLITLFGNSALAAGGYGGVGFGQGKVEFEDFDPAPFTLTEDNTASGFKIFGGYEFNDNAAVEVGYISFGAFNQTVTGGGSTLSGDYEGSGFFVDVLGKLPVNNEFSIFAKLGLAQTTLDFKCKTQTGVFSGLCTGESESEMNLRFGLGAEYEFTKQAGVRFEFERTADVGKDSTTGEGDIDYLGLALTYRF